MTTSKQEFKELLGNKNYYEKCKRVSHLDKGQDKEAHALIEDTCSLALNYINDSMRTIEDTCGIEVAAIMDEQYVQKLPLEEVARKHFVTGRGIQKKITRGLKHIQRFEYGMDDKG
ncbi:MAG: hypothetical protein IJ225_06580 [Solobacterium sp.]|nr:hypothetical protein [Solobacterium sp.]